MKGANKQSNPAVAADTAVLLNAEERYIRGMTQMNLLYWELIIGAAVLLVLSLVLAMVTNAALGVIVALLTAAVYTYFTADTAKKKTGVTYEIREGSLLLTGFDAKGETELYLPNRLFWRNAEVLCAPQAKPEKKTNPMTADETTDEVAEKTAEPPMDRAVGNSVLTRLHLPKTLLTIEEGAFSGCTALTELIYEGSREEWERVDCRADLTGLTLLFDGAYPVWKRAKQATPVPADSDGSQAGEETDS
ncbi:MAG: hypothetical protein IJY42_02625 [Clostridia bacterium]|nr:hypothetical protein [Clostridia bacterium]